MRREKNEKRIVKDQMSTKKKKQQKSNVKQKQKTKYSWLHSKAFIPPSIATRTRISAERKKNRFWNINKRFFFVFFSLLDWLFFICLPFSLSCGGGGIFLSPSSHSLQQKVKKGKIKRQRSTLTQNQKRNYK